MAFFPDVVPGQRISRSALLENNIRHVVNAFNGDSGNCQLQGVQKQNNTISVYNTTQSVIPAKTAVSFVSAVDGMLGIVPYNGSDYYGITVNDIAVNSVGSAVISGAVFVSCTGTGTKASPQILTPSIFLLGDEGFPVLYSSNGSACINMGDGGEDVQEEFVWYNSCTEFQFNIDNLTNEISVNGGYVNLLNNIYWVKGIRNLQNYLLLRNRLYLIVLNIHNFIPPLQRKFFTATDSNQYGFYCIDKDKVNDLQLLIGESSSYGVVDLRQPIIGTFRSDENGLIIPSSIHQLYLGRMYIPIIVPSDQQQPAQPDQTTEEPEESPKDEVLNQKHVHVDEIEHVHGTGDKDQSDYLTDKYTGDYFLRYVDEDGTAYYQKGNQDAETGLITYDDEVIKSPQNGGNSGFYPSKDSTEPELITPNSSPQHNPKTGSDYYVPTGEEADPNSKYTVPVDWVKPPYNRITVKKYFSVIGIAYEEETGGTDYSGELKEKYMGDYYLYDYQTEDYGQAYYGQIYRKVENGVFQNECVYCPFLQPIRQNMQFYPDATERNKIGELKRFNQTTELVTESDYCSLNYLYDTYDQQTRYVVCINWYDTPYTPQS